MSDMKFKHTNRLGFLLGFIDFFTAVLFFLLYMPLSGLQKEQGDIPGHKVRPYWQAYLPGIPTLFYTQIWMAHISEELKAKAIELGFERPYTSCVICLVVHDWMFLFRSDDCYVPVFRDTEQN